MDSIPLIVFMSLVALCLCFGMWTPVCCALAIFAQAASFFEAGWAAPFQTSISVLQTVALSLLGPGAFSIDSRWYGRRVVVLPGQEL
jgi:hypothetical protein